MTEKFKSFYNNHVPEQQNAHADVLTSLAASFAFPARMTEEILVHSHDLYCLKFTLEENKTQKENFQVKEVFETESTPRGGVNRCSANLR